MNDRIEQLMHFIQDDTNGYVYETVKSLGGNEYILSYNKASKWTIQKVHEKHHPFKIKDAVHIFNRINLDLDTVSSILLSSIGTKIAYYDMRLNQATKLLGQEVVEEIKAGYNEFARALVALVGRENTKSKLTLIKGDSE